MENIKKHLEQAEKNLHKEWQERLLVSCIFLIRNMN